MTDQDIDISGWVIEKAGVDDATYELPAGTILPGSNFVVIARQSAASTLLKQAPTIENADIDLDDAGEQLVLKTSPSGVVIDHTPTGAWAAGENTAVKRSMERHNIPDDGTNTHSWHSCDSPSCADARSLYWQSVGDTYGTPGGANLSFESEDVVVELELTPIDADHLTFTIENVAAYTALSYIVEYTHLGEEGEIRDALMGAETLTLGTRSFTSEPLYLGTCSTNGESCVSHAPATDIKVTVTLQGPDMTERVVTADLLTLP
jgi:hypothetical protein